MRKYKLYKGNMLAKTIENAEGHNLTVLNKPYIYTINKLMMGLDVGGMTLKLITGNIDSVLLNTIVCLSSSALITIGTLTILDSQKIKNSKKKLNKLETALKEKGIDVKFSFPVVNPNGSVEFLFDLNSKIVYVDSDEINFYDAETNRYIDITDDVNKCLMSKRNFRKYRKRISKNSQRPISDDKPEIINKG